jgi:hypothetical protein
MVYRCCSGTVFQSLTSCVKLAIGIVPARQVLDTVKSALTSPYNFGVGEVLAYFLPKIAVRIRRLAKAG